MITCQDLHIGYDKNILQKKIDLELKGLKSYVLLGKNGSGKSTFLKTLAALLPARSGRISYPQTFSMDHELSVVLTDQVHVPHLSVVDLVRLGRYPHSNFWGDLNQVDELIIEETLTYLKLTAYKDVEYVKLSDGLKQRALIARALAKKPKVLLLDEPFRYLDPPSRLQLVKLLKEAVSHFSLTLIFSTHEWDLVSAHFHNVLFINQEKCLIESSVQEICEKNLLGQIFDLGEGIIQKHDQLVISD